MGSGTGYLSIPQCDTVYSGQLISTAQSRTGQSWEEDPRRPSWQQGKSICGVAENGQVTAGAQTPVDLNNQNSESGIGVDAEDQRSRAASHQRVLTSTTAHAKTVILSSD